MLSALLWSFFLFILSSIVQICSLSTLILCIRRSCFSFMKMSNSKKRYSLLEWGYCSLVSIISWWPKRAKQRKTSCWKKKSNNIKVWISEFWGIRNHGYVVRSELRMQNATRFVQMLLGETERLGRSHHKRICVRKLGLTWHVCGTFDPTGLKIEFIQSFAKGL